MLALLYVYQDGAKTFLNMPPGGTQAMRLEMGNGRQEGGLEDTESSMVM